MTNMTKKKDWVIPLLAAIPFLVICAGFVYKELYYAGIELPLPVSDFSIGDFSIFGIPFYYCMMGSGFAVALATVILRRNRFGFTMRETLIVSFLSFFGGVLGLKVLFAAETWVRTRPEPVLSFGGNSFFGSFYAELLTVPLIARLVRKKPMQVFEFIAPGYLIILCTTRIGCFISGCCGSKLLTFGSISIYLPVQLFESVLDLIILSVCLWLDDINLVLGTTKYCLYPISLILYSISRFFLEFLRYNKVLAIGYTNAQLHSIFFIALGTIWLILFRKKQKKTVSQKAENS